MMNAKVFSSALLGLSTNFKSAVYKKILLSSLIVVLLPTKPVHALNASLSGGVEFNASANANASFGLGAALEECRELSSRKKDFEMCQRMVMAKYMSNGEDCVECFYMMQKNEPDVLQGAAAIISSIASPLAYFGVNAMWAGSFGSSQNAWADAYKTGIHACNARYNNYLDYTTENAMNPLLPADAIKFCNNNSFNSFAGFNGMIGNGFGGFGSPFINAGFSPGFMGGMMGPYGGGGMFPGGGLGGGIGMGGSPMGGMMAGGMGGVFVGGMGGAFSGGMGGTFAGGMGGVFAGGMGGAFAGGGGMAGPFGGGGAIGSAIMAPMGGTMGNMGGNYNPGAGFGGAVGVFGNSFGGAVGSALGSATGGRPVPFPAGGGAFGGAVGGGGFAGPIGGGGAFVSGIGGVFSGGGPGGAFGGGIAGGIGNAMAGAMGGGMGPGGMPISNGWPYMTGGGGLGLGGSAGIGILPYPNGSGSYWNSTGGWNDQHQQWLNDWQAKVKAGSEQNAALSQRYQTSVGASQIAARQRFNDTQAAGADYYNYMQAGYGYGYPQAMMGGAPYAAGNIGLQLGINGGFWAGM